MVDGLLGFPGVHAVELVEEERSEDRELVPIRRQEMGVPLVLEGDFKHDNAIQMAAQVHSFMVNTVQESMMLHINFSTKRLSSQFIKHFCSLREESTLVVSLRHDVRQTDAAISIRMTRHYPDLGSGSVWLKQIYHADRPIRSTTQIWVVTRRQ